MSSALRPNVARQATSSGTALTWRKSTHSSDEGGACVELAAAARHVAVRDSKHPHHPHLSLTPRAWRELVTSLQN
ncbi:hypothetical protein GCM10027589_07250 [Actinocorallia lasiicapitis]